jgi:hypothetical protein
MSLDRFINRPCILVRETATGERNAAGNEKIETVEVETVCELQPNSASETPQGVTRTADVVYFLPGEEVSSGNELIIPGEGRFRIQGEPSRRRNPRTQQPAQVEAEVERIAGPDDEDGGS